MVIIDLENKINVVQDVLKVTFIHSLQSEDLAIDKEMFAVFRNAKISSIGSPDDKIKPFYWKRSKIVMDFVYPTRSDKTNATKCLQHLYILRY